MCGALTCVEAREPRELTFVGSSGRYVAVLGLQAVVVWDLAKFSGTFSSLQAFPFHGASSNCNLTDSPLACRPRTVSLPNTHRLTPHPPNICSLPIPRYALDTDYSVWCFYIHTRAHPYAALST